MGSTTFSGPLKAGTVRETGGSDNANVGYVLLHQTQVITFDATLVQNATFYLPANAIIVDIISDPIVAYNSATSATLSVGTSSGGTQYASGVDAKATARVRPTFTVAQLNAMDGIGTSTTVVATVTSVGQPTAGQNRVTLVYAQV